MKKVIMCIFDDPNKYNQSSEIGNHQENCRMHSFFNGHTIVQGDIKYNGIVLEDELGRGNSHVYAIRINGNKFAMKQLVIANDYQYHNFLKEISMLKNLSSSNPYMIGYHGYFVTVAKEQPLSNAKKYAYIVMEYAQMNLSNLIRIRMASDSVRFSAEEVEKIILTLLRGFAELEKNNVAHCDIKPENILVLEVDRLVLKICDVGSSKIADTSSFQQATIQGTLPFLAPEVLEDGTKKLTSLNPFKSDVFSFGLLVLYIVLGKKFTSKERLEIKREVYHEIIDEWIQQACEVIRSQILQGVLKQSLSFDSHRRSLFKQLKMLAEGFDRKNKMMAISRMKKLQTLPKKQNRYLQQSEQQKIEQKSPKLPTLQNLPKSSGTLSNFQTRKRLTGKITVKNNNSKGKNRKQSDEKKRKYSNQLNKISPAQTIRSQKMKTTLSSEFSLDRSNERTKASYIKSAQKIFYIDKETHQFLCYDLLDEKQKVFVLMDDLVGFKHAKIVSILKKCPLSVIYKLAETKGKALHIQYQKYEGKGVDQNAPMLDYQKIYMNLEGSNLQGGYNNLLRSLCPIYLKKLHLRLTGSQITFKQVSMQIQRLKNRQLNKLRLSWTRNFMTQSQHQQLMQKISKLPLKDLQLDQSSNFIQYQSQCRWKLPQNLKSLSLNYSDNFLGLVIGGLASSLKDLSNLQDLHLNLSHNNLQDSVIKLLIRSLTSIPTLDKLSLDLEMNMLSKKIYAFEDIIELKSIRSLQLKINKCGLEKDQIFDIIDRSTLLFSNKLVLLKMAIDRNTTKKQLCKNIQNIIQNKNLTFFVIPYDYKNFMVYIEKKSKKQSGTNAIRVTKKREVTSRKYISGSGAYHVNCPQNKAPVLKSLNKNKNKGQILCPSLYTSEPQQQMYICLTCSTAGNQSNKYLTFCKSCRTSCQHEESNKHRCVRVSESNQVCYCPYNTQCRAEGDSLNVCAEVLGIQYKNMYYCERCQLKLCKFCMISCRQSHAESLSSFGDEDSPVHRAYFKCGGFQAERSMESNQVKRQSLGDGSFSPF